MAVDQRLGVDGFPGVEGRLDRDVEVALGEGGGVDGLEEARPFQIAGDDLGDRRGRRR
jgi:hypothetical protein